MPTVHYYGKKTNFVGKTLFEILANLRNFGLNRMLIKQEELLKYPGKPSYYIVKKVEPVLDETLQQGAIYAERIFKGARVPGLVFVDDESWHTDWQLIPKDQEGTYRVDNPPIFQPAQPLNKQFKVPPLMDAFLKRHYKMKGVEYDSFKPLTLPLNYKVSEQYHHIDVSKPIKEHLEARFRQTNKKAR